MKLSIHQEMLLFSPPLTRVSSEQGGYWLGVCINNTANGKCCRALQGPGHCLPTVTLLPLTLGTSSEVQQPSHIQPRPSCTFMLLSAALMLIDLRFYFYSSPSDFLIKIIEFRLRLSGEEIKTGDVSPPGKLVIALC